MIPKFRAWDKQGKTMNDVESINFDWNRIFLLDWCVACKFEDIELMQSTGLEDKNGVEIFEGDIVRIIDDGETDIGWGWNEEVIFHNGAFMAGDEDLLINVNFRCLVIGNIYENPELLEDGE